MAGTRNGTLQATIGNASGPVYTPFDEWPKELQDAYSYNPEKAEQLLDEAGYPRGADGVRFKVTYDFREVIDLGYVEIAAGYWKEIGVEVEINLHGYRQPGSLAASTGSTR